MICRAIGGHSDSEILVKLQVVATLISVDQRYRLDKISFTVAGQRRTYTELSPFPLMADLHQNRAKSS